LRRALNKFFLQENFLFKILKYLMLMIYIRSAPGIETESAIKFFAKCLASEEAFVLQGKRPRSRTNTAKNNGACSGKPGRRPKNNSVLKIGMKNQPAPK